jgi:hypothetical protein
MPGLFASGQANGFDATCYYVSSMPQGNRNQADIPAELSARLAEALVQERVVPRFVDSYVEEHQRYGLQVHAALYKDLIGLLQREALVALTARAFEVVVETPEQSPRSKVKLKPLPKKEIPNFRRKFLNALTRQQKWGINEALDFQRDLQMYEALIARAGVIRRRKLFETANHPFVDRCAFLLDSSFMEKARMAANRALIEVETLSAKVTNEVLYGLHK